MASLLHLLQDQVVLWHGRGAVAQVVAEGRLLVDDELEVARVGLAKLAEAVVARVDQGGGVGETHSLELLRDVVGVVPDSARQALAQG